MRLARSGISDHWLERSDPLHESISGISDEWLIMQFLCRNSDESDTSYRFSDSVADSTCSCRLRVESRK